MVLEKLHPKSPSSLPHDPSIFQKKETNNKKTGQCIFSGIIMATFNILWGMGG